MSNTLDRFWQSLRPLRKVGKNRGVIELPMFTAECGPAGYCLQLPSIAGTQLIKSTTNQKPSLLFISNGFTIALRFKPSGPSPSVDNTLLAVLNFANNNQYPLSIDYLNRKIRVIVNDGADYSDSLELNVGQWNTIFVTYDGATVKTYINGEVSSDTIAVAAPLTSYITETLAIGSGTSGRISEYVFWNTALTEDQIRFKQDKIVGNGGDTTCVIRFPLNEGTGTTVTDVISGLVLTSAGIAENNWSIDRPPVGYGGSFVVGTFSLSTGVPYSFKFPVSKPSADVNFIPCIRWCDPSDNTQVTRYKLWDNVDGVDIVQNNSGVYRGQAIPDDAVIEIWNIDGNSTVDLEEAKDLLTSILHIVTDWNVVPAVSDLDTATTFNTLLAAEFPLVFTSGELTFPSQQVYI